MKKIPSHPITARFPARSPLRGDQLICYGLILIPNLLMAVQFSPQNGMESTIAMIEQLSDEPQATLARHTLSWCAINALMALALMALRYHVLLPLLRIVHHVYHAMTTLAQEAPPTKPSLLNIRAIATDVSRFALLAQEHYHHHLNARQALEDAQRALAQITLQQHNLIATTSREMVAQYQSVLTYANYLEEHMGDAANDPSLRYGFDEVCESGFNLKLIAGVLTLLRSTESPTLSPVPIATMMQQTMLTLAPSLDRRAMKLSTAEVDLSITTHSCWQTLEHVLWMMILGTIRYAADESTLRMRCLYNRDRTQAIVSIVVSELSPGKLSPQERGAYLHHQRAHLTPHMFAETIRVHANLRLAELLLTRLDASISILPLTSHSCEICLLLPVRSAVAEAA